MTSPVSVVVPVLDEERALGELLRVLTEQLREDDELIVVDGGSSDGSAAVVAAAAAADSRIRLLVAAGTNIPAARNAGIAAASHELVACTDAGCVPAPQWLSALRSALSERRVDLATGVYTVTERSPFEAAMAAACYPDVEEAVSPDALSRWSERLFGRGFDASMPTGRSIGFTREAWAAVGGFPEHLATAEDVTFGRAIVDRGGSAVLVPEARVEWEQRPSVSATARMYYRYGYGDALSGDAKIVIRDVARLAAYSAAPWFLTRGGAGARLLVVAAAAAYLAVPLRRARTRPAPALVSALVPPALALKDLAKAAGCLVGTLDRALDRKRA